MFKVKVSKTGEGYERMTFYPDDMSGVVSLMNTLMSVSGKEKLSFEIEQMEEDEIDGMD